MVGSFPDILFYSLGYIFLKEDRTLLISHKERGRSLFNAESLIYETRYCILEI